MHRPMTFRMLRLRLFQRLGLLTPLLRFHRWATEAPPAADDRGDALARTRHAVPE
jgi:hypothetical protein